MPIRNAKLRTPRIAFVGAGAAACAIAENAARAGFVISGFISKNSRSARATAAKIQKIRAAKPEVYKNIAELAAGADVIFLAVPDRAIGEVAAALAPLITKNQVVIHLSGALGSEALAACRVAGASVASMHPLQTFPDRDSGAAKIPGTFVALEGDARARAFLFKFTKKLKMHPFDLPAANRALYHAAAVMASNFIVVSFDWAVETFVQSTGQSPVDAARALWPLLAATTQNLQSAGLPAALSGPVARGDEGTVARHLLNIKKKASRDLYILLSERAVAIALKKGSIRADDAKKLFKTLRARGPSNH